MQIIENGLVGKYIVKYRRYKAWQRIVSFMICVVVFCTTYALMLPAITQERETFCGFENHIHDDTCYVQQTESLTMNCAYQHTDHSILLHTHNEWCYDADHVQICTLEEKNHHIHTESCYGEPTVHAHEEGCYQTVQGELTCTVEESEGHEHGMDCYIPGENLVCGLEETQGHLHADSCYTTADVFICGLEETEGHLHDESCYRIEERVVCEEPETSGHTHGDGCYTTAEKLICPKAVTDGHEHQDNCYDTDGLIICGKETADAHAHSAECYTVEKVLICGQEESSGHSHGENCKVQESILACEQKEQLSHTHTEECQGQENKLSCGLEEVLPHSHSDECLEKILICETEDSPGHKHEELCYEQLQEIICGMEDGQEIPGVLVCEQEERKLHTHGADCEVPEECDQQEVVLHNHTEECISVFKPDADPETLTCTREVSDNHSHTERCYGIWILVCDKEQHTHEPVCYSDPDADVESAADWEKTFAHITLTGNYREDVIAIAQTQLGYTESTKNFIWGDDDSPKGYTRYGAWYGSPYGDWCAMFVSFCLHYAQVTDVGTNWGVRPWIEGLKERGLYAAAEEYDPVAGDLVFFDWNQDGLSDHVGLVAEILDDGSVKTIEGNCSNRVCYQTYSSESMDLLGYGIIPENPALPEETQPEYFCGMEEHFHEESCLDENGEVICELKEHSHEESCLTEQMILVESTQFAHIYTDSTFSVLSEDTMQITVTGKLPVEAVIRAFPVAVDTQLQVLCAYEIEIVLPDGTVFEPAEGESLNVVFQSAALDDQQDMQVYYIPEEGEPEEMESVVTEEGIQFEAPHFSVYAVMAAATDQVYPGTKYNANGEIEWSYYHNTQRDAFTHDSAYAKYFNANSPIGTAGSFHIVAFGTANLGTHTNGNILAHTLIAQSNFGTNGLTDELTYVQNYATVHTTSASKGNHVLVVGSSNTIGYANGQSSLSVNTKTIASPKHIVQDVDTDNTPFIDLDRVESEIRSISANMHVNERNIEEVPDPQKQYYSLTLTEPSGVGVVNFTASDLKNYCDLYQNNFRIEGFAKGYSGSVVINVDCSGFSQIDMPNAIVYVDGIAQSTNEVTEFSNGKVIWNFRNAEGVTINTQRMTGMVIAPGATVNILQNLNGTVVAENINVRAESHRTDFTGRIDTGGDEHIDGAHIHVYKVDKNNYGKFLPGAKFTLYEWTGKNWVVANQNSKDQIDITDGEGKVIFQNLTYNTAYRLEETQAPPGYIISTEYQYYYFPHKDTVRYPVRKPSDFSISDSEECIIHYYPNEASDVEVTSLHLQKQWQDEQGNILSSVPWKSVQVELIRAEAPAVLNASGNLTFDQNDQIIYGEPTSTAVLEIITLYADKAWYRTVNNLPVTSDDRKTKYTYSVCEVGTDTTITPDENGTVTVINTAKVTYVPLALQKNWEGDGPEDISEVQFQLYRMSRKGTDGPWSESELILDQITLSAANGWKWQAEDETLISEISFGNESAFYAYYVQESAVPEGYYPDYHGITSDTPWLPDSQNSTLEVTNHKVAYTQLHITKSWVDDDGMPLTDVSESVITVQIQQSSDGGETWTQTLEDIEIRDSDNWQYDTPPLPLQDDTGMDIIYRVVEVPLSGYISSGGEVLEGGEVHLVNRQIETTDLTIRKVWRDVNGSLLAKPPVKEIDVQLLRSVNNGPWQPYGDMYKVKAEDNWSLTIMDLPASDGLREESYAYSIREVTVSDLYHTEITEQPGGIIVITNTRTIEATDIDVEKRWFNRNGSEFYANSGSVEVKLFQLHQSSGGQGNASGSMINVTVNLGRWWSDGSFWHHTYSVPAGTKFTIQYSIAGSEYKLALNDLNNSANRIEPVSVVQNGSESIITYEYTASQSCSLVGLLGHYQGGSVNVSYSSGIPIGTVKLSVSNGWRHRFSDLPLYSYDDTGNITGTYAYFVEETGGGQYGVTYTDSYGNRVSADHPVNDGTITVRNTLPENSYALPETGGCGTTLYSGTGALFTVFSALLLLHTRKRRREDFGHQ